MSNPENKEQVVLVDDATETKETAVNTQETAKKENKAEKKNKKKDKKPKERKVAKKVKETTSELKKVSWLSFGQVCKRTAIVVGFVLLSTLVLFGVDMLLQLIYRLIV